MYFDDILIFSSNPETHVQHVRRVLKRLLDQHLYIKAKKCEFRVPKTSFLGYVVSEGEISIDSENIRAVVDWPVPTSLKEVQRILEFANFYRKFIRYFSSVAAPLHALTSLKVWFEWTPKADNCDVGN